MGNTGLSFINTLKIFRLLNASSVVFWFFYTKDTIGTPAFPYLLALHAFALIGFVCCWYRHDSKNAGRAMMLITAMTVLSLGLLFLYGRH